MIARRWRLPGLLVAAAALGQGPAVAVPDAARTDPRYALGTMRE